MLLKKQVAYCNFYKIPVLVLYALFFSVQLFFNFDIANHANYGNVLSNSISANKSNASVKADLQQSKRSTIRLNKRFQPEAINGYEPFTIEVIVCHTQQENSYYYKNPSIQLFVLTTSQLRGPPIVVA